MNDILNVKRIWLGNVLKMFRVVMKRVIGIISTMLAMSLFKHVLLLIN